MNLKSISFSILFSISLIINVFAQAPADLFKEGVKSYSKGKYEDAIEKFSTVLKYDSRNDKALFYSGMAYVNTFNYQEAINAFKRLESVNPEFNDWSYYYLAGSYQQLDQLELAGDYYKKFMEKFSDEPKNAMTIQKAKNRLVYCRRSPKVRGMEVLMKEPMPVTAINSISHDYTPQVSPTGTRLYFTSVRKGGFDKVSDSVRLNNYGEDIYFSELQNDAWQPPVLLPEPINSFADDFGSSFTGDGQTMVYVRCGTPESIGSCDLYITQLEGTKWTEPKNMGNVVNSTAWDSQPTINSDGTRIIFTSTRDGGYGDSDLYMTEKNHLGDWGIAQNLGSTVNTPFKDNSPSLASDGKTLYYASEGHPGFGNLDVFYCLFDNGKWTEPINIGAPVNSKGDDTNFSISATGMAYFASSRGDDKNYDIFQVELPEHLRPKPSVIVQGIVQNANTSAPIGAVVMVEDIDSGELIALNKSNSESGEYLIVLPVGRNYSVSATKDGFFFYSQSFDLPKDTTYQEINKNILLEPIEKGKKVVLNNIFFESGRAELKPISYVELNKAADLMKKNNSMVIEIGGHTDDVGSDDLNLKLSQNRANTVKTYLELAGVDPNHLIAKGYGETVPIASNATAEGKKINRRTEFVIIEF